MLERDRRTPGLAAPRLSVLPGSPSTPEPSRRGGGPEWPLRPSDPAGSRSPSGHDPRRRGEKFLRTSSSVVAGRAAGGALCARELRVGRDAAFLVEAGCGPPAVLLPSMLLLARTYRPTVLAMAPRFRVLALELPGSGRGSRLRAPWTLERYAGFIAGALQALQIERALLIGHSLSGAAALVTAAMYPDRLSGLVLAGSIGVGQPRSYAGHLLARLADVASEPRFSLRAIPDIAHNLLFHPRSVLSLIRIAKEADLSACAARVRAPTLLAWGARDRTVPVGAARALHRLIPRSTLYVSREGSHDWLVERPGEFAQALTWFVEGGES